MKAIGVIPARYGSTRFPGKPLALIAGKPLLQWVIEAAKKSKSLSEIIVATDHEGIQDLALKCGVKSVLTPSELATGSDRVNFVVKSREDVDIVVNIQGDEPLLRPSLLDELVQALSQDTQAQMATAGKKISDLESLTSVNTAKIILNKENYAIYFSRFPVPFSRVQATQGIELNGCMKHIGIYAYRKDFLMKFCTQEPVAIELSEGLEQLRALYLGAKIKVITVSDESWGVDIPADVQKIESMMERLNHGN